MIQIFLSLHVLERVKMRFDLITGFDFMKTKSLWLALLTAVSAIGWSQERHEKPQDVPTVMTSPAVEVGELETRRYPGPVVAVEEVDIIPRVTGYIQKVNFKEGDFVKEGDLLFEIEDREYAANLKKAEANVNACKSQILQNEAAIQEQEARIAELDALLKYKETSYHRNKELFERGTAVSQDVVDNAESSLNATKAQRIAAVATLAAVKSQLESSKSALSAAEALADLADFDMSHTQIKAPISGKIGKITVTRGNLVTPQFGKMVDIKSISPIYVRFAISERLFRSTYGGEEKIRQIARIRLELADGSVYPEEAQIALIDNKVDPKTNTIMIWATIQNADAALLPGSYATVRLSPKSDKPTCGVLLSAVQNDANGSYLYVLDKENRVERRDVKLGTLSDKYYEILSGAALGENVIVDGMNKVMVGQPVHPVIYQTD